MPNEWFADNIAPSTRRSRVEWRLRKQFDYAGERRQNVEQMRLAQQFFRDNLQYPKGARRQSIRGRMHEPTADERAIGDERDADVHLSPPSTHDRGCFGPGYGAAATAAGWKKTLSEKLEARTRLIDRVHGLEAIVHVAGAKERVGVDLVPDAAPGDVLLCHAGIALERLERAAGGSPA